MELLIYAVQDLLTGLVCFQGKSRTMALTVVFAGQSLLGSLLLPRLSALSIAFFTTALLENRLRPSPRSLPCRLLEAFLRGLAAGTAYACAGFVCRAAPLLPMKFPFSLLQETALAAIVLIPAALALSRHKPLRRLDLYAPVLLLALGGPLSVLLLWFGGPLQGFPALLLSALIAGVCIRDYRRSLRERDALSHQAAEAGELHQELHTYRSLVRANQRRLDRISAQFGALRNAPEFSEELASLRETTGELGRLSSHMGRKALGAQALPKTGSTQLDELLEELCDVCRDKGVLLRLTVLSPWQDSGPHTAAMVAEQAQNALHAIERCGREDGEIVVAMGILPEKGCYGIDVWDNGEPFRREILESLGRPGVTTGGTGYGFPATLTQLAKCGGSLEVNALEPAHGGGMTTCVSFLFDHKGTFTVRSEALNIRRTITLSGQETFSPL